MKKNDWVYHNKYGVGQVSTISAGYAYVDFNGQVKIFALSDASKHLIEARDNKFVIIHGELKKYIGTATVIKLPQSISRIGEYAFANNTNIVSVDFNGAVFAIGDHAFENCTKLLAIQNCDGLIRIGSYAFHNCIRLTHIVLPSSVQIIEKNAFCDCGLLKEIFIPSNIKSINASVFRGCSALEKITGMSSVTAIHDGAFSGCSKLHIDLPNGLEQIHNRAFYNCDKLHPLVIPESVITIADDAFANNDCTVVLYGTPSSFAEKFARKHNYPFYNKKVLPKPAPPAVKEEMKNSPLASTLSAIKDTKVEKSKTISTQKTVPVTSFSGKQINESSSSATGDTSVVTKHHKTESTPRVSYNTTYESELVKKAAPARIAPEATILSKSVSRPSKKRSHDFLAAVIALFIMLGSVYGICHDRINNIAQFLANGEVKTADGIYTGDLDWGIIQGTGSMQFPDGRVYDGLFASGKPSGSGTMRFSDGSVYEGLFISGEASGIGSLVWADSSSYKGEWSDDYMNGHGTMVYSDGSQYNGKFQQGQRSGSGTYQWPNGNTYQGEWLNDLPNGSGYIELGSGATYEGVFFNGNFVEGTYSEKKAAYTTSITFSPHQDTTFTIGFTDGTTVSGTALSGGQECSISYSNGDTYEGTLVNGARTGYGVFKWESGESYDGNWLNDEMTGDGTFTFADGSSLSGEFLSNSFVSGTAQICSSDAVFEIKITDSIPVDDIRVTLSDGTVYSGTYTRNKLTGTGTITYSDDDKYVGAIKNGQMHGKGTYTWSDGEMYVGSWSDGKMNGAGTYYFGLTQRITGSFKDNKPHGTCYYYTSDGTRYTTYWTTSGMENIHKG